MSPRPLFRTRVAAGLAISALLFSACGGSSSDSEGGKTPAAKTSEQLSTGLVNVSDSGTPVKGGTLTIGEYSELRSMDPRISYSNGAAGGSALTAVFDPLMRYDWSTQKFVPQLAESLDSKDNVTWTMKLRKDATFSDGTPVNADAVVNSIAAYTDGGRAYGAGQWLTNVESTKKVDDTTVEFKTRLPWGTFPNFLSHGPGLVMAPAAYKDPAAFKPIGAGAFTFGSYKPTEALILKANDKYWGGRPNLDELKFVWPGGDPAKAEAMKAGDVDSVYLRDDKIVSKLLADKTPGMRWTLGQGRNVWINMRADRDTGMPEVRQALQAAWDPAEYLKLNGEDTSLATKSLFDETSPWYTDVETPKADRAAVADLLKAAKAKGFDGELEWAHFADPASTKAAVNAKALLEAAGFKIKLRGLTAVADQIKMMYADHDFDLAVSAATFADEDPYMRLAGVTGEKSPTNATGYSNPEMNTLVTELAAATNATDGKDTMVKIEELWQKDSPSLGVATGLYMQPWNKKVHGINPSTETLLLYDKAWKEQ